MKTSVAIRALADELEEILRSNPLPNPNDHAIGQIRSVSAKLRNHCLYCSYRSGEIEELADQFYSAQKHYSHISGAKGVLGDMEEHIYRIRAQACSWEAKGN